MRFLVLGAGALGGYYGGLLHKGGADVTFLLRPNTARRLTSNGLRIKLEDGLYTAPVKIKTTHDLSESFDVIILTCKSYDLDDALEAISPAVGSESAILPILNGVNHIELLADRFGEEKILGGVTQFLSLIHI